jgi:hypothetical protein
VARYWTVLSIFSECSRCSRNVPLRQLATHLRARGIALRPKAVWQSFSTGSLLEVLLHPYLTIDVARFDADMPGFSGGAAFAVLRLGHTREVRRRLQLAETFLSEWCETSGLNARSLVLDAEERVAREARQLQKVRDQAASELQAQERAREAVQGQLRWEAELLAEVTAAVLSADAVPYRRLNFLVYRGAVFFLERGWWHKLPGDPHTVAAALEADGVVLTRLAVTSTGFGYIPAFARRHAEEPVVGWGEASLEVATPPAQLIGVLDQARVLLGHPSRLRDDCDLW